MFLLSCGVLLPMRAHCITSPNSQREIAKPHSQRGNATLSKREICQAVVALKTLQCEFTQTKYMRMLNDKMVSSGRMYFQKDNRLRWEYVKPYTYTFVLNGDKVLLKSSQRSDVIDVKQNKVFKEIAHIMLQSVVGDCLNDDKNFRSTITIDGGDWLITLKPLRKNIRQLFQNIVLRFSRQQALITKVELTEKNGDKTIIELRSVKKNETIAPDMFALH